MLARAGRGLLVRSWPRPRIRAGIGSTVRARPLTRHRERLIERLANPVVKLLLVILEHLHDVLGELIGQRVGAHAVLCGYLRQRLALLQLGLQILRRHAQNRGRALEQ